MKGAYDFLNHLICETKYTGEHPTASLGWNPIGTIGKKMLKDVVADLVEMNRGGWEFTRDGCVTSFTIDGVNFYQLNGETKLYNPWILCDILTVPHDHIELLRALEKRNVPDQIAYKLVENSCLRRMKNRAGKYLVLATFLEPDVLAW